jgi:hypothetical protein
MGNWISRDSYLDKHACSARNITWQYILNNGSLPNAYSDCLDSQAILYSHCCREGRCYPYFLDIEFERSKYDDWDGLGSPYMPGEKTSSYWSWFPCKIMWGEGEHHDHIIGVDGKYVKNESTYYPTNEVDIKGNDLRARGLMHSPDMRKHRLYTHDYHPTSHKSPGYHRKWLPQPISGPMKQEAITEDLPPWTEWTEQYQSQSNLPIKDGRVVAGVVLGLIVGISVIIVRHPPYTATEIHESSPLLLKILN